MMCIKHANKVEKLHNYLLIKDVYILEMHNFYIGKIFVVHVRDIAQD